MPMFGRGGELKELAADLEQLMHWLDLVLVVDSAGKIFDSGADPRNESA
ncbi:hypothetical protein [Nocardia sp. NPDC127526]